ncbi:three-Cys-motif partner protein TcmP [Lysinibacillus fusiformis]|uniref:three-Cys-motif partner protein TcmP n=1 Tax=Lysinibacillus fusiformis TaxID=28031 RepID=UPI00196884F3|nr:three-Cys-motif partner protein TcmP [Lysinibacillus fusiformis]QSB10472.1 three-Cys-motif partner protein TcmP [Lysinibacillus fusiformis]
MTKQFFNTLQKHSDAKIEILNNYYIPWLRKINLGIHNQNRCLVIDGFAGPGIYEEDQAEGSPIKLIKGAIEFCEQCSERGWDLPNINIILIEGDIDNYSKLQTNISSLYPTRIDDNGEIDLIDYPTINIITINDTFANALGSILDSIDKGQTLIPSFCFVDPFGFSHTPFELFQRYLQNEKAELLFNFMFEEINRFIMSDKNKKLIETYQELFGIEDIKQIRKEIGVLTGAERKKIVIDFYSRSLLEMTEARYVLDFEFKKNGRTKMFLIYATKSIKGLEVMKDVMWKVDGTGMFLFSDQISANQLEFEFINIMEKETHQTNLATLLAIVFKRKRKSMAMIESYVLENTIYPLSNYLKPALKILEKNGMIEVERFPKAKAFTYTKVRHINF